MAENLKADNLLLLARIRRLEAELEVRTVLHLFPQIPEAWRGAGRRSAYLSGYESGWRNRPNPAAPYEREHLRSAWRTGYDDGQKNAETCIHDIVERHFSFRKPKASA